MADTKVITNGHFAWFEGPSTAIPAVNWTSGPTFSQVSSLLNISDAVKIDGSDFGLEASEQSEDRSFADAAGAQSRSYNAASGNIEIYTPGKGDVSGIYVDTWNAMSKPRTKVIIGQRPVKATGAALAAGDEVWLYSSMTDERVHNRNDVSRTLGIGLLPQGDILPGYIVPASTPTSPTVTGGGALSTAAVGTPIFLKVSYQGRNITIGAKYVSSNEAVFKVRHGVVIPVAAGTATLTVSYPGAATLAPITVTVS